MKLDWLGWDGLGWAGIGWVGLGQSVGQLVNIKGLKMVNKISGTFSIQSCPIHCD